MSVLDPPVFTTQSYMSGLDNDDDEAADPQRSRRRAPGSREHIQQCIDCGRWGNVENGLFEITGWMGHGFCIKCRGHELARETAEKRGYLGDERKDVGMWIEHIEAQLHGEVAMLQLGLLVDHDKFLPQ
ncbi:hypothetical protein P7C70_g8491, partial [Phenoliferia sp. Uapishka_3]